ncbi:hypothetical protein LEP1GSC125_0907 [Leptospira mayottensis 200901122]|uniref:Uncharacterized protein n=1 Tax=Leptospira mayottensis 200901122 TaxID=1193010 RepID=A0AA87MSN2_9LEPT|nr:hypothetical protein LEP1GSC125_0907 [Leptospira mayottensis 200901122]
MRQTALTDKNYRSFWAFFTFNQHTSSNLRSLFHPVLEPV